MRTPRFRFVTPTGRTVEGAVQGLAGLVTQGLLLDETALGRVRREARRANLGKPLSSLYEPRIGHVRVYTSLRVSEAEGPYVDVDLRGTSISDVPEA